MVWLPLTTLVPSLRMYINLILGAEHPFQYLQPATLKSLAYVGMESCAHLKGVLEASNLDISTERFCDV